MEAPRREGAGAGVGAGGGGLACTACRERRGAQSSLVLRIAGHEHELGAEVAPHVHVHVPLSATLKQRLACRCTVILTWGRRGPHVINFSRGPWPPSPRRAEVCRTSSGTLRKKNSREITINHWKIYFQLTVVNLRHFS